MDIDYDVYAEGEAVLGWLNASLVLRAAGMDWNAWAAGLLDGLGQAFAAGSPARPDPTHRYHRVVAA